MDEVAIPSRDGDGLLFRQVMSQYGGPAFVRRARQVHEAYVTLLDGLQAERRRLLDMVSLRLGTLFALAGCRDALRPLVDKDAIAELERLHAELAPRLRVPVAPTSKARVLRSALQELRESCARFNQRWLQHLYNVDLKPLNALREGYNQNYLLEKECAVGSARIARMYFQKLMPLTVEELVALLPPLAAI